MSKKWSKLTKEYARYRVRAIRNGIQVDPTNDAIKFAVIDHLASPDPGDFADGVWETMADGTYIAKTLIGPLSVGTYGVWIQITDNPEIPVRRIDTLYIS